MDFGTTTRFWLDVQAQYDLDTEHDRLGDRLDTEVTRRELIGGSGARRIRGATAMDARGDY